MSNPTILVAAADEPFVAFISENLAADGHSVRTATAHRQASRELARAPLSAAILGDLDTPGDAIAVLRALRAGQLEHRSVDRWLPVIAVTSAGELATLRAFEAGADDAVHTATTYLELRARVRGLIRRAEASTARVVLSRTEGLEIAADLSEVRYRGTPIALTPTERGLLAALASDPHRVFSHAELLRDVWGFADPRVETRTISAHACRLRRSLHAAGTDQFIHAVRGQGYRLLAS